MFRGLATHASGGGPGGGHIDIVAVPRVSHRVEKRKVWEFHPTPPCSLPQLLLCSLIRLDLLRLLPTITLFH